MKTSLVTRFAGACALTLVATAALAEQPDRWVRYVESTGNQYVDTGITGRWNTKIEAKVEWMNLADSAFVGCGDWETGTRFYPCYCLNDKGEITLTESGLHIAEKTLEKHVILTKMLMSLGVDEETAMEDACKMEHDISDKTWEAIKKHAEFLNK